MEGYRLVIKPSGAREIEAIASKRNRQRIVARIRALAEEPRPRGVRKLSGTDKYRIRQGEHRVLYTIEDDQLVVVVIKVGHRREVYRV